MAHEKKVRAHLLLLVVAAALSLSNCSHTSAYVRPGFPVEATPQPVLDDITYRLILIGDAGEPAKAPSEPVLKSLAERAAQIRDRTTIVFLGDNIYPAGLPAKRARNRKKMEAKLVPQIDAVKNAGAKGIFVPGNHDWNHSKSGGIDAVKRQQDFVTAALGPEAFYPRDGCPGPVTIDLAGFRLLIIDTEWWLHKHEKGLSSCFGDEATTVEQAKARFLEKLTAQIESAGTLQVVIAAHHPLATHGPHGGFFDWKDHLFPLTQLADWLWLPLPGIGSLYPLFRWHVVKSDQDLAGKTNREMVRQLKAAISHAAKPVIYAAGHDHALQVLQGRGKVGYVLVSGAGSQEKSSKVGHGNDTFFAHVQPGFMELDVLDNGSVFLRVIEQKKNGSGYHTAFSYWLFEK